MIFDNHVDDVFGDVEIIDFNNFFVIEPVLCKAGFGEASVAYQDAITFQK
jgi:hypothetical protein